MPSTRSRTANSTDLSRRPKLNFSDLTGYRRALGENQQTFWSRFGVGQSGGSRYESGRAVPIPVRLLLTLYANGTLTEAALKRAIQRAKR